VYVALGDHDTAVPSKPLDFEGISPSFSQPRAERMPTRMDYAILRELHGLAQPAELFAWPVSRQLSPVLRWEHKRRC
jgi:hypothetical protein